MSTALAQVELGRGACRGRERRPPHRILDAERRRCGVGERGRRRKWRLGRVQVLERLVVLELHGAVREVDDPEAPHVATTGACLERVEAHEQQPEGHMRVGEVLDDCEGVARGVDAGQSAVDDRQQRSGGRRHPAEGRVARAGKGALRRVEIRLSTGDRDDRVARSAMEARQIVALDARAAVNRERRDRRGEDAAAADHVVARGRRGPYGAAPDSRLSERARGPSRESPCRRGHPPLRAQPRRTGRSRISTGRAVARCCPAPCTGEPSPARCVPRSLQRPTPQGARRARRARLRARYARRRATS